MSFCKVKFLTTHIKMGKQKTPTTIMDSNTGFSTKTLLAKEKSELRN